jgi:hypothetical protein
MRAMRPHDGYTGTLASIKKKNMKTRTIFLTTIIFLSLSFTNINEYKIFIPFEQVVYQSEIIANGKIIEINELSYVFKIQKLIKGDSETCEVITIKKFMEWPCDMRRKKHKIGQELIVYVKGYGDYGWNTISGSTGEIIVEYDKPPYYSKKDIIETTNIILMCFEKMGEWKSKINCNKDFVDLKRKSNSLFDQIVRDINYQNENS